MPPPGPLRTASWPHAPRVLPPLPCTSGPIASHLIPMRSESFLHATRPLLHATRTPPPCAASSFVETARIPTLPQFDSPANRKALSPNAKRKRRVWSRFVQTACAKRDDAIRKEATTRIVEQSPSPPSKLGAYCILSEQRRRREPRRRRTERKPE